MDREAAAAGQLRLFVKVFELRLQLARWNGSQSGVIGGEPRLTGLHGEPRRSIASAAQSGVATGSERITIPSGTKIPLSRNKSESAENPPSPASTNITNSDSGTVPVQRDRNGENEVK